MRHLLLLLAALLLMGTAAHAQTRGPAQRPPPHKPYAPVAVDIPDPPDDPSFAAFRKELGDIARRRVYADLAAVVVARGFFWDRDFAGGFDPSKTGVENLAIAIGLEAHGGSGWRRLDGLAAEPIATPAPLQTGVICGPPAPLYNENELDRLIDTTKTASNVWTYPRNAGGVVRAAPREGSPVVETLGQNFVHVLGYEAGDNDLQPEHTAWARVATPTGKAGYVAPGTLRPLGAEQLCYVKDVTGRWRIAGYVGRDD